MLGAGIAAGQNFNATFYGTVATIIPVLFLALVVQGRTYQNQVKAVITTSQTRRSAPWPRKVRAVATSMLMFTLAFAVVVAGILGELFAVWSLQAERDSGLVKWVTTWSITWLVLVAAAGPVAALWKALTQVGIYLPEEGTGHSQDESGQPGPPGTVQLAAPQPCTTPNPEPGRARTGPGSADRTPEG